MTTVRHAALRALLSLERGGATLPETVDHERRQLSDGRDRGLLLELVAGALRWQNAIDAALASVSRRPLGELPPPLRATLRLGAYQLRHLDRVPAHAVIHEAVELARVCGHPRATGFVNAVLRALVRRADQIGLPPRPGPNGSRDETLAYLSITLSHPAWLAGRWLDRYGFDATEAWCRFNNEPPEIGLRPLGGGTAAPLEFPADAGVRPSRHLAGAMVARAGALGRLPPELREAWSVQDEGSQLIACITPVPRSGRVLDVCGSPGNKAVLLAERGGPQTAVLASDFRASRVAVLRDTLARAGAAIPVVRLDATRPLPFGAVFDTVLVDAPCSGLGTLRRDPDAKWTRTPDSLSGFAKRQTQMLESAAQAVRPGGCLVYATCSSEPEENDVVVEDFLSRHPGFAPARFEPDVRLLNPAEVIGADGRLRTLPFRHQLDAFFAALLVRRRTA